MSTITEWASMARIDHRPKPGPVVTVDIYERRDGEQFDRYAFTVGTMTLVDYVRSWHRAADLTSAAQIEDYATRDDTARMEVRYQVETPANIFHAIEATVTEVRRTRTAGRGSDLVA